MKKTIVALSFLILVVSGCIKEDKPACSAVNVTAPAAEIAVLKQYIDSNHIEATADPRGFYYKVNSTSTSAHPTVCSNITVNYRAMLLTTGTEVDSSDSASFTLSSLIVGWQEALPLVTGGSSLTLYLPPSLAYGATANGPIPANSYLVFTINLLAVF